MDQGHKRPDDQLEPLPPGEQEALKAYAAYLEANYVNMPRFVASKVALAEGAFRKGDISIAAYHKANAFDDLLRELDDTLPDRRITHKGRGRLGDPARIRGLIEEGGTPPKGSSGRHH